MSAVRWGGWVAPALLLLAWACSDPAGEDQGPDEPVELVFAIDALSLDRVLPGTSADLVGSGFLEDAAWAAVVEGQVQGRPVELVLDVERLSDRALRVRFPVQALQAVGDGQLVGLLTLEGKLGEARGAAEVAISAMVVQRLSPRLDQVSPGMFPASPIEVLGADFIRGSEGQTLIDVRGTFVRDRDGEARALEAYSVPCAPPAEAAGWGRGSASFVFDPAWVGIEPGHIQGEARLVNEGPGWKAEGQWVRFEADLLPPVIEALSTPSASRGQAVRIFGNGFLGGSQGLTVVRLEGTFHAASGESRPLNPPIELAPLYVDGTELLFSMTVAYDFECQSGDLGAEPGELVGRATPITTLDGVTTEGEPLPLTFEVLPSKQVVWLRFLPAFTDSLRLFGLRDFSREVKAHIVNVVRRDYAGVNLEIRLEQPTDFLLYSTVEIGGPDPNAQQLFGLDNTLGLDRCNQRLDDKLAGRNADSDGAYGGIFVESFLQLSARNGTDNPLANPVFDEIFDPVIDQPAKQEEWGGPRQATIDRALRTLGNLVGNTTSHEIGHSLGLPVAPGCGQYHNAPGDRQIMDCGRDRPFAERAELTPQDRAVWTPENRRYLEMILPVR